MDFSSDINKLFREEITLIDNRLQPCRQHGIDRYGFQQLQQMLYEVVDKMGDASAKAQGLPGSITTGKKLELANHHLYLMVDGNGNNGKGSALGILKVGRKKLFIYDNLKVQHELEPLCILDFYVHESRQRMGCGRKLFDFMLTRENIRVENLAIDRPSPKFLSFLKKHYYLETTIPQVNNFVIFEKFFNNRNDGRGGRKSMVPGAYNHQASPLRPNSGNRMNNSAYNTQGHTHAQIYENRQHSAERSWTPSMAMQAPSHMGAGEMMYSRHRATPPMSGNSTPNHHKNDSKTPTQGFYPSSHQSQQLRQNKQQQRQQVYPHYQQQQDYRRYQKQPQPQQQQHQQQQINANGGDDASFYRQLNAHSSPSTYYNMGTSLGSYRQGVGGYNIVEQLPPKPPSHNQRQAAGSSFSTPNFGNRGRQGGPADIPVPTTYQSPSQDVVRTEGSGSPAPPSSAPSQPHSSYSDRSAAPVPLNLAAQQQMRVPPSPAQQQENVAHRPPSGKQSSSNIRRGNMQPPMLQREGPPATYKDMLNMHHTYQGRNGHLNVPNGSGVSPSVSPYKAADMQNTSWTVGGVLREQRLNAPMANRYYNSTRLW